MIFGLIMSIVFGLLFGSFGSVILSRWGEASCLQQASSILWGRSECPHCKHRLSSLELIPVLSFCFQGGKCHYCHKKISWLYPILEIGTALIFGLIYRYTQDLGIGIAILGMLTGWILWLLLVYDVLWYEVHIPLIILGYLALLFACGMNLLSWSIFWGSLIFLLFFLIMYLLAKWMVKVKYHVNEEGIGMGDLIVAPYLGAILFAALPKHLEPIDFAFAFVLFLLMSSGVGILWYFVQNKYYQKKATFLTKKLADHAVPFLPAMILGIVLVILWYYF